MNKQFFAIIVIVVGAMVALFAFTGGNKDNSGGDSGNSQPSSHMAGDIGSPVKLIEYGDFQCPACKSFHPVVYENQESWASSQNPAPIFESYATQLSLDVEKFKTDMNSSAVADTINADVKAAQEAGGNSTPTFVLNDKKIDKNPASIDEFKKLIDDELAKQQ